MGADVVKVEHPETGDLYRSLVTMGLHAAHDDIDASFQMTNRGKQSVSIDLKQTEGRELLYRMEADYDVFLQRDGYDAAAYWMRAGLGAAFTPAGAEQPVMQRPAFGDVMGGLAIAGAIAAAMYKRAATGETSEIDVSLLNIGM